MWGGGLLWNMSFSMISTLKSLILKVKIIDFEGAKSMSRDRGHLPVEHVAFTDFDAKINDFESQNH